MTTRRPSRAAPPPGARLRVATWNINNVVKRQGLLLDWLARTRPDVVALQELKAPTAAFPVDALREAGYEALVQGQRAWNGVALLGRGLAPLPVLAALPGDAADQDARYLEAALHGVLFACLYLPNGNPQPGPKFDLKMRWFERLRQRAAALWATGQPVVMLGDWNVVPTDADIYKPDTWRDNALLQPAPRAAFAAILAQGWTDALRVTHPADAPFTFWDYRRQRWQRDAGLRIDHILASAAVQVEAAGVDREERGREGASDHAPVWAELRAGSPLARYNARRDFGKTREPAGTAPSTAVGAAPGFVVQKHWASRLHYDLRLEHDGVMLSWAVPKGPSLDPAVKQMAIRVEDHPLAYNEFEGDIPRGEYGGGRVIVWDRGTWSPVGDPREGLRAGKIVFDLHGQKLAGRWELVRIAKPGDKQDRWMLFKKRGDAWARAASDYDVIRALPDSVVDKPLGLLEEREPKGAAPAPTKADLGRAKRSRLPETLEPALATLVPSVPSMPAGEWIVETKFDGYRILVRIDGEDVRLFTRNGHDWTHKLPHVARAAGALGIASGWLDGEIVVQDESGRPDFNRLQNAIDHAGNGGQGDDIVMFIFDAPFLNGRDLRAVPLASRRLLLEAAIEGQEGDALRLSTAFRVPPDDMLSAACRMGLEGVMVKRADSPYAAGRSEHWLKLKCQLRQEFVVIGFTERAGSRHDVGSLLLGYHVDGVLRAAGSVGTGWDAKTGRNLHALLAPQVVTGPPVDASQLVPGRWTRRTAGTERWVMPANVVEVAFTGWTPDGHVRHGVFKGLRQDKPAGQVVRELARPVASVPRATVGAPTTKVTHPQRVIDPSTGLKKIDLVRYYESVAEWMLPHLKDRPVSLVRAPTGITGELFFQKHPETRMPGVTELDPGLWPGHAPLLAIDSVEALVAAAQMNTVEFHTWNSRAARIGVPDRFILDLDPGEGVSWPTLREAAVLTRSLLTGLGLESWLKTSGGKGLHVVVPITPRLADEGVKAFSEAIARHMAQVIPSRFVAVAGGRKRQGKVFIDYLRNGHGQTTACAFSARARPGMGVSMPIAWDQLAEVDGGAQWTLANAREHLSFQNEDPWRGYWTKRQSLAAGRKALGLA